MAQAAHGNCCCATIEQISLPETSHCEPYSQGQDELQSRLNKIHRERYIIVNLLQKWTARSDTEAKHASSVSQVNHYNGLFTGGFAALDRIFLGLSTMQNPHNTTLSNQEVPMLLHSHKAY